jgi:hypothetical protein
MTIKTMEFDFDGGLYWLLQANGVDTWLTFKRGLYSLRQRLPHWGLIEKQPIKLWLVPVGVASPAPSFAES